MTQLETPNVPSIGYLIDHAFSLRERKKKIMLSVVEIDNELLDVEQEIQQYLRSAGITTVRARTASATLTEQLVPQIENFEEVFAWVLEAPEERAHFLARRVNSAPYKELIATGESVPGVSPYNKQSLSVRKLS